ncbi:MAG: hypothetical protein ACM3ZB_09340 [bacterium]|jgi:hypothetical protein
MNRMQPKGALDRGAAADLWRRTLSQVPTLFGRLAYLASLRDSNTGRYEHFGLSQAFGEIEADRVLRESHEQTFSEWLCQPLEMQQADLDQYLSELKGERAAVLATWMRLAPYRNLPPSSARDVEKRLFLADLETLLAIMRNQYGVNAGDPDA